MPHVTHSVGRRDTEARTPVRITPAGERNDQGWYSLNWKVAAGPHESSILSYALPEADAHLFGEADQCDPAVTASLLYAMERGQDVIVEARVCPKLLDGLEVLQQIWSRWRPRLYRQVSIRAEEERSASLRGGEQSAVFAFSGGVDANYSLFRHHSESAGRNNLTPDMALLVQWMDIPLDELQVFQSAAERAERILVPIEVPLLRMKCNSRIVRQDWENSFGLQLTARFLTLQQSFRHAVRGSAEPFESLIQILY